LKLVEKARAIVKPYEIEIKARALRAIQEKLPVKVVDVVLNFIHGPLAENPYRVGKQLDAPFKNTWGARRGDYRIIYAINKVKHLVIVLDVDHRSHMYATKFLGMD
jgi:mRNA-degrading endonuclease RelE of RelBE toxin-antitoxin system